MDVPALLGLEVERWYMYRNGGDEIAIVLLVLIVIVVFALLVGICAVVGSMADTRGRSVLGWVLFSLLAAPISIILLLCLGETDEKRKKRLEEEAFIFCKIWDDYFKTKKEELESNKTENQIGDMQEKRPGMSVNDMYKKHK